MKKKWLSMLAILCCGCIALGFAACGERGEKGEKGDTGAQGEQGLQGNTGESGKSAYELYKERFGYTGTEEEWLLDLVNGELATKEEKITFKVDGGKVAEYAADEPIAPPALPERKGFTGTWGRYTKTEEGVLVEAVYTPDVVYTLRGETYEVTGLNTDKTDIYILDVYEGKAVTSIKEKAFWNCKSLQFVRIPDSITKIGATAFCQCESLIQLSLPDGVTEIEENTFLGCGNLTMVTAENVQSIGDNAFAFCSRLVSASMRKGLRSIGAHAFDECSALRLANIPEGVISIGHDAFAGCISLVQVLIPSTVTRIEARTFYLCAALESIQIPAGITYIGVNAFSGCNKLERVFFGETNGWQCVGDAEPIALESADLANSATAAVFVNYTYDNYEWTRTEE